MRFYCERRLRKRCWGKAKRRKEIKEKNAGKKEEMIKIGMKKGEGKLRPAALDGDCNR